MWFQLQEFSWYPRCGFEATVSFTERLRNFPREEPILSPVSFSFPPVSTRFGLLLFSYKPETLNLLIIIHLENVSVLNNNIKELHRNHLVGLLQEHFNSRTIMKAQYSKSGSDGNPEPDLVHATGCKQPTLRQYSNFLMVM
jgi:hypothetical protein